MKYWNKVYFLFSDLLIFSCILVFMYYWKPAGYYSRLVIQIIWTSYLVVQYNLSLDGFDRLARELDC